VRPGVLRVNVEPTALAPAARVGLALVDGGGHAVDVEHASEQQSADARAHDRDVRRQWWSLRSRLERRSIDASGTAFQACQNGVRAHHETDGPTRGCTPKERIVAAAIELLDAEGDLALTFRAVAARLATGSGAIYWHVANKDDLLAATTDDVIAGVMAAGVATDPRQGIRDIALATFDAVDAHHWVGSQLARAPWQFAMLQLFEGIGIRLQALGVPADAQFDAASALLYYILGAAGQNAANARLLPCDTDRATALEAITAQWTQQDPARYPFVHDGAARLRDHDDRAQFLAGVDLILAGLATRI
jgi:AcrR family transcriptional regulator